PLRGSPPLVPIAERAAILASATADAELVEIPDDVTDISRDGPFTPGRTFLGKRITQRRVGTLRLSTGALGVQDPTDGSWSFSQHARSVPPGSYPVYLASIPRHVLSVRLQVGPEGRAVRRWCAAGTAKERREYVVGVEGGRIAVFDAGSFVRLTMHTHEV